MDNETALDPEEERLREAKVQEEARKRDKERMAKETRGPWGHGLSEREGKAFAWRGVREDARGRTAQGAWMAFWLPFRVCTPCA